MSSTHNPGRVAGFLYLLLVIIGLFSLIYVPSTLIVSGNATATASNIAAHDMLFRLGIVGDLVGGVILIFLALALYRLFKGAEQNQEDMVFDITTPARPGEIAFMLWLVIKGATPQPLIERMEATGR